MRGTYAAVDLGATRVRAALGDESGLKKKISEATDGSRGSEGISKQIIRLINDLNADDLTAIGIGSIGPLDLAEGRIFNTPNLPFKDIPIVEPLTDAYEVPVRLLNDCCAGVLGEHVYGAGAGLNNLVYVTLSTGLGGGAMVDGHLLVGKDGNAHEVGHLTIDPRSELVCGCGCRGHWEAYCSGANIPKYARLLLRNEPKRESITEESIFSHPEELTAETLFRAASGGDPLALLIVEKIGGVNAIGFADIVNVYDPELITIGGSIALKNPNLVLLPIMKNIDKHLINRRPEIRITPLGDDIVLFGALATAMRSEA